MNKFTLINMEFDQAWMHADGDKWIRHYEAIDGVRAEFYEAYRTCEKQPKGRLPWTVDNRRYSPPHQRGFRTLQDAMNAIEVQS